MLWFLIIIATILTTEIMRVSPIFCLFRTLCAIGIRAPKIPLNPKISDTWKEKAMKLYAMRMASSTLLLILHFTIVFSPFLALFLLDYIYGFNIVDTLMGWWQIVLITLLAISWYKLRNIIALKSEDVAPNPGGYSTLQRILHYIALSSPSTGEALFDLESKIQANKIDTIEDKQGRHVYISGLARAGTTALLRALHNNSDFASLTYRDMPFVMAPNIWSSLGKKNNHIEKVERAHADGILVDLDSPEALEEIFWRCFCKQDYIKENKLIPHIVSEDIVEKYRLFVAHALLRYDKKRYLSKNNNNILRLPALRQAFPEATILVPFRDPLSQSISLLNQHKRFMDTTDPFTERYMSWTAHHEFGKDHRPFYVSGHKAEYDPQKLSYWLNQWKNLYNYLFKQIKEASSDKIIAVCYEDICSTDRKTWRALCDYLQIKSADPDLFIKESPKHDVDDPELLEACNALYAALKIESQKRWT